MWDVKLLFLNPAPLKESLKEPGKIAVLFFRKPHICMFVHLFVLNQLNPFPYS